MDEGYDCNESWWLRDSSIVGELDGNIADCTYIEGSINIVRPVIHINLSNYEWDYAGKESSKAGSMILSEPNNKHGVDNPKYNSDKDIATWDCIYFGCYWQEDTTGDGVINQYDAKQPIKWRVLSVDGDDAYLLADKGLDCKKYNDSYVEKIEWKDCTLRKWLNETFYNTAFDKNEQKAIIPTNHIVKGNSITDAVSLLADKEKNNLLYGFFPEVRSKTKYCKATTYAKKQGVRVSDEAFYNNNCLWWVDDEIYCCQAIDGWRDNLHYYGDESGIAVRPVLHINLLSEGWEYAGKEYSENEEILPIMTPKPDTVKELNNPIYDEENDRTAWECIYFGNYWQEDTDKNGVADQCDDKLPIRWRVLSVDNNDAFLISDKGLDYQYLDSKEENVRWKECYIRSWLNDTFYSNAFNSSEQKAIKNTSVTNYSYSGDANREDISFI